ncbi:MAG TPA: dienelactone hydrolase family protein [Blastocatellia bacterium]|nr:dienelactone hydrolase family protein [Blastocatellia bacterium]
MANQGRMVDFSTDGRTARGYLIELDGPGPHPALIVVHEWWGLNDHIKDIAGRFADQGYVALAPDLYEGKLATDPDTAGKYMQGLDQKQALATLDGAINHIKSLSNVAAGRIGVTGFCMGGTYALLLACHSSDIKASVPFYGDVPTEDVLKNLSAPVLFIGAENDFWITKDKIDRLRDAMQKFNKPGEVKVYSGASHAFFNNTRPDVYNKEAAADVWQRVTGFFASHL